MDVSTTSAAPAMPVGLQAPIQAIQEDEQAMQAELAALNASFGADTTTMAAPPPGVGVLVDIVA